jgi:DNA repair ATPase RecN
MIELILAGVFVLCTLSLVIVSFLYLSERSRNKKIVEKVKKINLRPIEDKIKKIRDEENKYFTRLFRMEMFLEDYREATEIINKRLGELEDKFEQVEKLPKDYERTYRDVVRRILELDNKFNEKFQLVGEAVLKLRDEMKK